MPRPRRYSPATGSWSARASTGRPRSPPGLPAARVLSTSGRGPTRMCGRSTSTSRTSKAERESGLPVTAAEAEDLLRHLAPQVLGAVVRRYGNFDLAEDATQEAMAAAAMQWPRDGPPENPRAWLITVASRRLTDLLRSEQARREREDTVARWTLTERGAPRPDEPRASDT